MRIAYKALRCLVVCFLMCGLPSPAHAQETALTLQKGAATVRRTFRPRRQADADFYLLKLRRGQTLRIKVDSNEV
jgi:hypothetical protein